MTAQLRTFWRNLVGLRQAKATHIPTAKIDALQTVVSDPIDIAPNDPLLAYFESRPSPIQVEELKLESPALTNLKAAGVQLIVPLVNQGELMGLINLGSRLSDQEYSGDDYRLLENLVVQASPAVRVAQLVRQQQVEAQERERIAYELQVARLIQQTLLPKNLPTIDGWNVATYYQPAREVGGDFYDFYHFPDGRLGLVVADVTDKGVPAALVMATTRTMLRASAERLISPGQVLERVNDILYPDIPAKMFVTCFYALLEPDTGRLRFANAGHDVPYKRGKTGISELRATGMPLGLMPGMTYDEMETTLLPGESVLLYSDGLVEAHNPDRVMFGFPRLKSLLAKEADTNKLIDFLLQHLAHFTGRGWEQEDDVTLVTLACETKPETATTEPTGAMIDTVSDDWQLLAEFAIPSEPGNERAASSRVIETIAALNLDAHRRDRLQMAVAEATMNALEHGNLYRADLSVQVRVIHSDDQLRIYIIDHGLGTPPSTPPELPDLDAKLAGFQSPRGWGLFLIQNLVDAVNSFAQDEQHVIELILNLKGDAHG